MQNCQETTEVIMWRYDWFRYKTKFFCAFNSAMGIVAWLTWQSEIDYTFARFWQRYLKMITIRKRFPGTAVLILILQKVNIQLVGNADIKRMNIIISSIPKQGWRLSNLGMLIKFGANIYWVWSVLMSLYNFKNIVKVVKSTFWVI